MASNYYWIKFYIETLDDPKVGRLNDTLWRRFFELCLLAGELYEGGKLPPIDTISWRLRVDTTELEKQMEDLHRRGFLEYRAEEVLSGYWYVKNFEKRQQAIKGSQRVQDHRIRQRKNEMETPEERTGNDDVTTRYTDIDIDKDKDKEEDEKQERPHIMTTYENEIGLLTPYIAEQLLLLLEDYGENVLSDAIKEAAGANVRKLSYIQGILKNWKANGRHKPGPAAQPAVDVIDEVIRLSGGRRDRIR